MKGQGAGRFQHGIADSPEIIIVGVRIDPVLFTPFFYGKSTGFLRTDGRIPFFQTLLWCYPLQCHSSVTACCKLEYSVLKFTVLSQNPVTAERHRGSTIYTSRKPEPTLATTSTTTTLSDAIQQSEM